MLKIFAISTSEVIARAVKVSVGIRFPELKDQVQIFLIRKDLKLLDRFRECAEALEREIKAGDMVHDRFIGVLDFPHVENALGIHALSSVQGMLVLAFPEIQWVPLYKDAVLFDERDIFKKIEELKKKANCDDTKSESNDKGTWKSPERCEMTFDLAYKLCKGGYSPLFDGDGLRGQLMKRVHGGDNPDSDVGEIFTRQDMAVVMDEEPHFAFLNSYTAYRFGYRAYPILSAVCADSLLREKGHLPTVRGLPCKKNEDGTDYQPTVVAFEDVCLQFPDSNMGYSNETEFGYFRDKAFPVLRDCHLRVISTASQKNEKFVAEADGKKTLPKRYFAGKTSSDGRPYKECEKRKESFRRWFAERINHFKRRAFNRCGDWYGYWLFSSLDFGLFAALLVATFFWEPAWVIFVVIAIFVFRGLFGRAILHQLRKLTGKIPFLEKLRICRGQHPFLPLLFINHDNQPDVHQHKVVRWCIAQKPLSGIFGLRNWCSLPTGYGYKGIDSPDEVKKLYKKARNKLQFSYDEVINESGHAAPGAAQEVATFLLRRCERMDGEIIDAEGAVHAAVLATVATELLNYKTPSLSIEALRWKHYYEVRAESEFVGIRLHSDMEDRYIDIHNSLRRICVAGSGQVREDVFNSGAAEIVDALVKLLNDNGKLEEANFFVRMSRMLHRRMLKPISRTLMAYPEWVLRSGWNFTLSICGFFLLFWIYWYLQYPDNGFCWAFGKTMTVVVSRNDIEAATGEQAVIITLAKQIGVLHLAFLAGDFMTFMLRK